MMLHGLTFKATTFNTRPAFLESFRSIVLLRFTTGCGDIDLPRL